MEEYILDNNLKVIYKHTDSELTSICISINAGAGVEKVKYGLAHATEHMVYKGTRSRTEKQINEELSNIFGFNNAMTNYPYVIYYGTLLKDDLSKGLELLSDIVINPSFIAEGFKEEMDVIKEELKEWDEELEQYCEDKLFYNCFDDRRIKYPIIGTKESLESITLDDIKKFYKENYFPENTSIAIISSLEGEDVKKIIDMYFGKWKVQNIQREQTSNKMHFEVPVENPKIGIFNDKRDGIKTCRVQIVSPIGHLNQNEMRCLRIFNQYFGEGTNSILYDTLRTQNGLVYDVITKIANENYIKLYKITFNTGKENVDRTIGLVKECIEKLDSLEQYRDMKQIEQLIKNFKLKRLFREEQSIILAKELATYDSMFGDYKIYTDEIIGLDELSSEDILRVGNKVLEKMTIQIIEAE